MTEGERVAVAVGSNIDPRDNLPAALHRLRERTAVVRVSRVYRTEPVGAPGSPPFLNAAVLLESDLPPARLRDEVLRPIESELGRRRGSDRNAPRPIDLDIAIHGGGRIEEPGLRLPDPELAGRAHLALPLADVAPSWVHPESGLSLAAIAAPFAGRYEVVDLPGWL